ncbi:MAG: hypothetical protein M1819_005700 [Sarea resinae]|nr:MAG: hypothetical protein M1819_005700 [Sarea resinae]
MAAPAATGPSPRSSWDFPARESPNPSAPTLFNHPASWLSPPESTSLQPSAMPPLLSAKPRSPPSQSQSYFSLHVDPTKDVLDSSGVHGNLSPSSLTVRSATGKSPKAVPLSANPEFEEFQRKQSELQSFNLGNLSNAAMNLNKRPSLGRSASSKIKTEHAESSRSMAPPDRSRGPNSKDRMDLDTPVVPDPTLQQSLGSEPSFFDIPRQQSPLNFRNDETADPSSESEFRHPRLSLPHEALRSPPLPSKDHRAQTLPASLDRDGLTLITPKHFVDIRNTSKTGIILLDLRTYPQFAQSRINGAINLCIPTTLLKRPSFTVQKLLDTFSRPEDKEVFLRWKESKYIIFYDANSAQIRDAVSAVNTLRKFTNEGWRGHPYILRGGFAEFSKQFPDKVESVKSESASPTVKGLSLSPSKPGPTAVAGGCPMPATKSAANPFFGNIRQNMDLIGGVGQFPIRRPALMSKQKESRLPSWIRKASDERDRGKSVADKFLNIEKAEQKRMQEALSGNVCYGTPGPDARKTVQIAGIEKGAKNRYNNIWPYDHSRVKLQGVPAGSCDYINANHVKASWSKKEYIATQGPIPSTFDDFWRVVWEQDVRVIIMLTAETEGGQLKCHPYWTGKDYGPLRLKALSERRVPLQGFGLSRTGETESPDRRGSTDPSSKSTKEISFPASPCDIPHIIIRTFTLSHNAHPFTPMREITQLQYSSWPDFGTPAHPSHLLGIVDRCNTIIRSSTSPGLASQNGSPVSPQPGKARPVLVHCSAGCGRTGTFCTVDSVIDMLQRQQRFRGSRSKGKREPISPMEIDSPSTLSLPLSRDDLMEGDSDWINRDDVDLVAKTVEDFRHQRLSMVQSLRQFVLCYESVLEWLVDEDVALGGGWQEDTPGPAEKRRR